MVIAPQVVTVADVGVLPDPWTRTQTFASVSKYPSPRTAGVPRPFPITSAFIYGYHIAGVWVTGRARQNRNLSLVLEGNTPRSPRMTIMPSTTMLTRGLTGTTGALGDVSPAALGGKEPILRPLRTAQGNPRRDALRDGIATG